LVERLPQLIINHETDIILRWLEQGTIVLTGEQDEINRYDYIDNRSDVEKARTSQYNF